MDVYQVIPSNNIYIVNNLHDYEALKLIRKLCFPIKRIKRHNT